MRATSGVAPHVSLAHAETKRSTSRLAAPRHPEGQRNKPCCGAAQLRRARQVLLRHDLTMRRRNKRCPPPPGFVATRQLLRRRFQTTASFTKRCCRIRGMDQGKAGIAPRDITCSSTNKTFCLTSRLAASRPKNAGYVFPCSGVISLGEQRSGSSHLFPAVPLHNCEIHANGKTSTLNRGMYPALEVNYA